MTRMFLPTEAQNADLRQAPTSASRATGAWHDESGSGRAGTARDADSQGVASRAEAPLREGGQGSTPEGSGRKLRSALVLAEVSLALVLLAGAGLLMRTFTSLLKVDLGLDPRNLMTAGILSLCASMERACFSWSSGRSDCRFCGGVRAFRAA